MTLDDKLVGYLISNGLVNGDDFFVDTDLGEVIPLNSDAIKLIKNYNKSFSLFYEPTSSNNKEQIMTPSKEEVEGGVFDKNKETSEYINERKDFLNSQGLIQGKDYDFDGDILYFLNDKAQDIYNSSEFNYSNSYEPIDEKKIAEQENRKQDYIGDQPAANRISDYNEDEQDEEELNTIGASRKIVNKWLCQALDKNDGKAVREACIVLKSIEKK